ncbi:DUF6265 family protein [Aurantibacillus circumpalustris]|uniref:DUF6265 family protein n=1 Tax=Aurantibacillus circumpalustris TaxID=3036359 RepID=UPI00295BE8DF|nr:DUF6265 family protein [Aurantibacillus circumpalustris]
MEKNKTICILAVTCFLISCSNETKNTSDIGKMTIDQASWILGKWQNVSIEGSVSEHWDKLNDSTYSGRGLFIQGKDTLSKEILSLEQHGVDLYYIPTVNKQNDGKAVNFKLSSMKENVMVFENPSHDFPQKITYNKITSDSLVATISGMVEGKERSESFPMSRDK